MHQVNIKYNDVVTTQEELLDSQEVVHGDDESNSDDECKERITDLSKIPAHSIQDGTLNLKMPDRYIVCGQSESGKTSFIRWLIQQLCNNFKVSGIWWFGKNSNEEDWLPSKYRLDRISKTRIDAVKRVNFNIKSLGYHQIIILDDIIGEDFHGKDKKWYNDFIATSRHENITIVCGIQYLKAINPCFRENIQKYIICDANRKTLDCLYDFCTTDMTKQQWIKSFKFILGKPISVSTVSGSQNLKRLTVPYISPNDIKY